MRTFLTIAAIAATALPVHGATVVTQVESRANPTLWLMNPGGSQGIAHQQVMTNHTVSAVATFDGAALTGVDIVYLSPADDENPLGLTGAEVDALEAFVNGGGRLIVSGELNVFAVEMAPIATRFAVTYGPASIPGGETGTIDRFDSTITTGPAGIVCSFTASQPNDALTSTDEAFIALAQYSGGSTALGYTPPEGKRLGDVVFLTDTNTFDNTSILLDADNQVLWSNLFAPVSEYLPGDVNATGTVTVVDLLAVLGAWETCVDSCCPYDFDNSGNVGVGDILITLGNWTPNE